MNILNNINIPGNLLPGWRSLRDMVAAMCARGGIVALLLLVPILAYGQMAPGSWRLFPVFSDVTQIIESPQDVYYVSGGCLYRYDKDNEETRIYNGAGDLSDFGISDIYYNYSKNYLLVAYTNSNIDILYPDGERINLPDIKVAQLDQAKGINDVKFCGDEIYVATEFGVVVFSDTRHEVKQSGRYGKNVVSIALTDSDVVIATDDNTLYAAPKGERLNSFDVFTKVGKYPGAISEIHTLDPAGTLLALESGHLNLIKIPSGSATSETSAIGNYSKVSNLIPTPDGIYFRNADKLYFIDNKGDITDACSLPEPLRDSRLATLRGPASLWAASEEGVGEYKVEGANLSVLHDRYLPSGATSFGNICKISPLPGDVSGFYVCNLGMNQLHPIGLNEGYGVKLHADIVTPEDVTALDLRTRAGKEIENPTFVIGDPEVSSVIYVGSASGAGVIVTRDGVETGRFSMANAPMHTNRPSCAHIDSEGNFWLAEFTADTSLPAVSILPASRRLDDPSKLTVADWVQPDLGRYLLSKDVRMVVCESSNTCVLFDSQYRGGIIGYNYGKRIEDVSDDSYVIHNPLYDTDGKSFTPDFFYCGVEDKRGRVWIGTSAGVIEISRPAELTDPAMRVRRLKVPRNDGSNLADYLLGSEDVYAIAVDNSNRKWLGTKNSGLYLVSENGDAIISHYTVDNSLLPSNTITALYADPNSNSIYIGTLSGLLEFSSDSSPAKPDYSDVYAYPNPVTPEYTGFVTITGLMDGSLVKVVDASMRLVAQLYSEGGMAQWDLSSLSGGRAKSGVYYVLASTRPGMPEAGEVVTKILIVN